MNNPKLDLNGRHSDIVSIIRYFSYAHLKHPMRTVSMSCYELAEEMITHLPDSSELAMGLRKLLEAKDCFVRAALDLSSQERT